jgi:outer membrane PBP1 activator LpoA protein
MRRVPRILGQQQVHVAQQVACPCPQVPEVADRCRDEEQYAGPRPRYRIHCFVRHAFLRGPMLHASLHSRQVRALALAAALAIAAACVSPPAAFAARQDESAESLSRSGQHEAAAQAYERQAKHIFRAWDTRLSLLAAREYLQAGLNADAERMLAKVDGRARGDDAVLLARIQAELAIAKGDGNRALAALATIPTPWPAPLATELLLLQARADFIAGKTLDGIRALEERGSLVGAADARAENYRLLVHELQQPAVAASIPAGASARERAWVELAQILADTDDDEQATARRAAEWQARHPNHPGSELLPKFEVTPATRFGPVARPGQGPATVALLLPLSGPLQQAGAAVRDGFISAILAQRETAPKVLIYDTAELGAELAYRNAVADAAGIVVGPLTREDVATLVSKQSMPVPTLVLNSYAGDSTAPAFMYEFTLDPEQEARAAARRIAADGHTRGIALFPRNAWGERVYAAFASELQATGVDLMAAQYYETGSADFSGPLRLALGRYAGAADRSGNRPAPRRDAVAEALVGPQFAFVAANAANARALIPQLRFQMSYALAVYATSDAWDPSVQSAPDMDGLEYPEFPWILSDGDGAPLLWDVLQREWAASGRGRMRLYAFGHDAAVVANAIWSGRVGAPVDGLTGRLAIGDDGRVQRELDWAEIVNGRSQPAGPGALPPAGEP